MLLLCAGCDRAKADFHAERWYRASSQLSSQSSAAISVCQGQAVQGGWEADETVEAAAARETVEEAGVRGVLEVWPALPICWAHFGNIRQHTLLFLVDVAIAQTPQVIFNCCYIFLSLFSWSRISLL